MRRRVAAFVLVLTTPFAVALLVGDLSTTTNPNPDYALRPPDLPAAVEQGIGVLSLVLALVSTAVLTETWRRDPPLPGFLSVLLPLVAVGAMLGLAWRVMTAAVIGANIGAGLLFVVGTPMVIALLIVAGVSALTR